jgi:Protein of unknown function (DUF2953).
MTTALIIIASVLLFFLILLLCPVTVYAHYENEAEVKIRYLFFRYTVVPQPAEEKEEKQEPEKKEENIEKTDETESVIRDIIKQRGLSGFLHIVKRLASIATGTAKKMLSHMVIDRISTDIAVADGDAAQTAILYGNVCSVVYTSFGVLVNNMKCKDYHINIVPDFQSEESRIRFDGKVHILLLFLVSYGLSALIKFLKVLKETGILSKFKRTKMKNKAVH